MRRRRPEQVDGTLLNGDQTGGVARETATPVLRRTRRLTPSWPGLVLIGPALLVLLGVIGYPLVRAFYMSLHTIVLIRPQLGQPFVGLQNYFNVIQSPYFLNALWQTFVWTSVNLVAQLVLGLLIALVLNNSFPGRGLARGAMLIPWVVPSVVAVLTWRWMYDGQFGIINSWMVQLGIIDRGVAWLGNTGTAMGAVLIESIWKGTPFVLVMLLAGLQAVPTELLESAKVDGANAWQRFWHVTMPMLRPTVVIAATLTTIYSFNNFNSIWLMTEGGPLRSTETLTILTYKTAFQGFNLGEATAIGVITFVILFIFVAIFGRQYVKAQLDS